jgi:hypothetical protein
VAGALSDKFGRKKLLLILSAFLFAVTSSATRSRRTFHHLHRVADSGRRGHRPGVESFADVYRRDRPGADARRLVSINQLTIVIGMLAAQLINWSLVRNLPRARRMSSSAIPGMASPAGAGCSRSPPRRRCCFSRNVFCSRKPALAGEKGKVRKTPGHPEKNRRRKLRRGAMTEISATLVNEIQRVNFRELLQPKMRRCWCWASCWRCSSNGAAST